MDAPKIFYMENDKVIYYQDMEAFKALQEKRMNGIVEPPPPDAKIQCMRCSFSVNSEEELKEHLKERHSKSRGRHPRPEDSNQCNGQEVTLPTGDEREVSGEKESSAGRCGDSTVACSQDKENDRASSASQSIMVDHHIKSETELTPPPGSVVDTGTVTPAEDSGIDMETETDAYHQSSEDGPPILHPYYLDPFVEKLFMPTLTPLVSPGPTDDSDSNMDHKRELEDSCGRNGADKNTSLSEKCSGAAAGFSLATIKDEPEEEAESDDDDIEILHSTYYSSAECGFVKIEMEERVIWCKLCDTYYKNVDKLRLHIWMVHGMDPTRVNRWNYASWDLEIANCFDSPSE